MRCRSAIFALLVWSFAAEVQPAPRPVAGRSFVVVLDPGHGGSNTGCRHADGVHEEKGLTLAVAVALQKRLSQRLPAARVVLTRSGDITMTLAERTAMANRIGADLLLSIHANASPRHDQTGFETFVLDPAIAELDAAATAARAQAVGEPRQADPLATMLAELEYATNRRRASRLAAGIQRNQAARFPARVDRGVRPGPFDVLMGAKMPAVLTEIGFLDNVSEGAELLREPTQDQLVDGLADALVDYYRDVVLSG